MLKKSHLEAARTVTNSPIFSRHLLSSLHTAWSVDFEHTVVVSFCYQTVFCFYFFVTNNSLFVQYALYGVMCIIVEEHLLTREGAINALLSHEATLSCHLFFFVLIRGWVDDSRDHLALAYEIWAKMDNLWMSYYNLTIFNIVADCFLNLIKSEFWQFGGLGNPFYPFTKFGTVTLMQICTPESKFKIVALAVYLYYF